MSETLLSVRAIHTYYGDSYVLQGLSLELHAGTIVAILGRNGMGKTTLIRSVAGLTPPREGDIRFKGASLRGRPPYAIAQSGIALVPQGRRIFRSLTVRENLLLPTSALALNCSPKVLLLDEPCAGLSPSERQDISRKIGALPRDITVVMIEHDMDVALGLADRVTVLHRGRIIVEGSPAEVQINPEVRDVYFGHV